MRKKAIFLSKGRDVYIFPFFFLLSVKFLFLMMLSSVAFCSTWQPIGPDGGNFIFSVTNPNDANEVTAITTSPSPSNVYRSKNAGESWSKIGEIPYTSIRDVCTFDFLTLYAISSSCCYHSTDGGATWTEASLPSSAGWANCVCVDPTDSNKVYIAGTKYDSSDSTTKLAFFKSTDAGMSWSTSSFFAFDYFHVSDMAISMSEPCVIYIAGIKDTYGALFRSLDGGDSWTDISSFVDTEDSEDFRSVAIDSTDEDKVYVGGYNFYSSVRSGYSHELSWARSPTPIHIIYSICIDPAESSRIYIAGNKTVGASTDYGQSWIMHDDCLKGSAKYIDVAPANPSKVYIPTSAGFFKSVDSDTTWSPAHKGIHTGSISALAVTHSTVIVDNSSYLMTSKNSGNNSWQDIITPESCGKVCDILINPENPNIVLILEERGGELFRSADGCSAWTQVDQYLSDGRCFTQDPFNSNVAYAGGRYRNDETRKYSMSFCKTTNGGISWPTQRSLVYEGEYHTYCYDIAVAPSDSSIVYAGGQGNRYPKIFRSKDDGNTWNDITENLASMHSTNDTVYAIWISPHDPGAVLVGTSGGVFAGTIPDRGGSISWSVTPLEHLTRGFACDPVTGILYATTSSGVYETHDDGSSWHQLNDGLGCLDTLCIAFDSENGLLFVGTNGGSVWRLVVSRMDLDNDGIVNFNDYAIFANNWMEMCSAPDWCEGSDLNKSGNVDFGDLLNLVDHWFR